MKLYSRVESDGIAKLTFVKDGRAVWRASLLAESLGVASYHIQKVMAGRKPRFAEIQSLVSRFGGIAKVSAS